MNKKLLVLIIVALSSFRVFGQIDSLKNDDLRKLSSIVLGNISIPDSILLKPAPEAIILEIMLKENEVFTIDIWHKQGKFLYEIGKKIAAKIESDRETAISLSPNCFIPVANKLYY